MKEVLMSGLLALALLGCDSIEEENLTEVSKARARWEAQALDTYTIVQERLCYCPGPSVVQLVVQDGQVVEVRSAETGEKLDVENPSSYMTVDEVFDLLERVERQDPARFEVNFDTRYSFPANIDVDPAAGLADDEIIITMSDFRPISD